MSQGLRFAGAAFTLYSIPLVGTTAATLLGVAGADPHTWWKVPLTGYVIVPLLLGAVVGVIAGVWKLWGIR